MTTSLTGNYYAILGIGGFNLQLQDASLVPLTTILQYNLSNTIQFNIDVRFFNQKIGLLKDSQNRRIIDTSYNIINSAFPTETFSISSTEFTTLITDTSNIISVGFYENIYNDYATLVRAYFGSACGFASLFKNVNSFNINNGVFDSDALLTLLKGSNDISGSGSTVYSLSGTIDISNVNSLLAYAVDNNVFGNRDGNYFAADWDNSDNYGVGDGFLSNDIIYIPQGSTIHLGLNIAAEPNTTPRNNKGIKNTAAIVAATNYTDGDFSVVTNTTTEIISRTLTAPIVIKMIDTTANSAITLGTMNYSIDYTNISVKISFTDYSYNFFIALWNNGASTSGYIYDNSFSAATEIKIYELNTFYISPFNHTGISGVGESQTFNVNFAAYVADFTASNIQYHYVISGYKVAITYDMSFNWSGFYTFVNILANGATIDTQTPLQPMLVLDGQYNIVGQDAATETLWEYQAVAYDNSANPSSSTLYSFIPTPTPTITDSSVVNIETFFDVSGRDASGDWIVNISAAACVTWSGFYYTALLYRNSTLITTATELSEGLYYTADASYQMTDLTTGTAYAFYLTPRDAAGVGATSSPVINITTPIIQPSITAFYLYNPFTYTTVGYATTISFELYLIWTGYYYGVNLYRSTPAPSTLLQQQTFTTTKYVMDISFDVTDIAPVATYTIGQTYSFYITPLNSSLTEYTSTEILSVAIWPDPVITLSSVSNVVTIDTTSTLTLNWNGYYNSVFVFQDNDYITTVVATQYTNTSITYNITALVSNTSYAFNFIPRDDVGAEYTASPYMIITTPQAPYNMNVITANTTLTVIFSYPTSGTVTQYQAYANNGATTTSNTGTASPIIISGLTRNLTHTIWVTATFSNGYIATSATITGFTAATTPTTPLIETIAISTANTVDTTSTVTLLWSGYYNSVVVYKDAALVTTITTGVWQNSNITYTVTGLVSNTSYEFYLVPRNTAGVEFAASNTITATTPQAPYNINIITAATQFTVVFSLPTGTITQYQAFASGTGLTTRNKIGTTSPLVITALTANRTYNVYIVATFTNGYTATSATVTATTVNATPTVPIIQSLAAQTVQTVVTTSSYSLLWTGYYGSVKIYENGALLTTITATQWTNINITYSITGRTALTQYQYYLLPYDTNGVVGTQSTTLTITPPDAAVITTTTTTKNTITVNFTPPIISGLVISSYTANAYYVSTGVLHKTKSGTASPLTIRTLSATTAYYVNIVATFTNTYTSTSANAFATTI